MIVDKQMEQLQKGVSRRNFLAGAGALGAATVLAGCGGNGSPGISTSNGFTDFDILNYALNLEYLEAEFYLYAATGQGLSAADAGAGAGTTTVPTTTKITGLTTAQQNILNEIAFDEQRHVQFLRAAITSFGGKPVSRPNLNLTAFGALGLKPGPGSTATAFSPFSNNGFFGSATGVTYNAFDYFITGAYVFEDVGVTAYNGASGLISNAGVTNGILAAAAGILAVEAYHAAYVRQYLTANAVNALTLSTTKGTASTTAYYPFTTAVAISALRQSLGSGEVAPTLPDTLITAAAGTPTSATPAYAANVTAANANGMANARTLDQVTHIVYGNATAGVTFGGFFPNGLNSVFAQTLS